MSSFWIYCSVLVQVVIVALLILFLPISDASVKIPASARIVHTSFGPIFGKHHVSASHGYGYTQFLGLPYAEPPTGRNRFARTKAFAGPKWTAPRDVTQDPPICKQISQDIFDDAFGRVIGQEDCLVLNVFVPDACRPESPCPVMVFFHPGGFNSLDGSPSTFGPDMWMDYDVILVSINYRLGVLGFLSLDSHEAPGNLGLWDQQMALQWTKREINSFGGNDKSITLMGSGAGASSVLLQMMSPKNRKSDLFHKVISQSGSPVNDRFLRFSRSRRSYALELAKSIGCKRDDDSKTLSCLRLKSADDIQYLQNKFVENAELASLPNPFVPAVDGNYTSDPFLPDWPEALLRNPDSYKRVPVLIGDNADEGIAFMKEFISHPKSFTNFTEFLPILLFNKPTGEATNRDVKLIEVMKRIYFPDGNQISNHRLHMKEGIRLFTDFIFHGRTGETVRLLANTSDQPVYHYIYRYSGTHSFGDVTVYSNFKLKFKLFLNSFGIGFNMRNGYAVGAHRDELLLMFKMNKLPPPMNEGPISDRDKLASRNILRSWTNFAKNGDPSLQGGMQWIPSQAPDFEFNVITSKFNMTNNPIHWRRVDFVTKIFHEVSQSDGNSKWQNPSKKVHGETKKSGRTDL